MKLYQKLARRLKAAYPQRRVAVRRLVIPDGLGGDCRKSGRGWLIRIDRTYTEQHAMDVLVHEFPHVPAWQEWVETGEHGPIYCEHYRRCYKIYEELIDEFNSQC